MRVVRNNGYVKRKKRIARWSALGGALALGLSIVITFISPSLLLPAYALLIIGFITFNTGMQQVAKWSRSPRSDELLDNALRRLNDRYTLIHYPAVTKGHPEHVMVFPGGLLVITTREVHGRVTVKDNRWHRVGGQLWRLIGMSGPQLGNPTVETERDIKTLASALEARGLPGGDDIEGMIAFLNPRVELEVVSSDLTVATPETLLAAVRDLGGETVLPTADREAIVGLLAEGDNVEGPASLPSRATKPKNARAA